MWLLVGVVGLGDLGGLLHGAAFASLLPPFLPPFSAKVVEKDGFALAYLVEAFVDGDS